MVRSADAGGRCEGWGGRGGSRRSTRRGNEVRGEGQDEVRGVRGGTGWDGMRAGEGWDG